MAEQPTVKKEKKTSSKPQLKPEKKKKNTPASQANALPLPNSRNNAPNPQQSSRGEVEVALKNGGKVLDSTKGMEHDVLDRPPPDPVLLTLVGRFLQDFGFESASSHFENELRARRRLNGWKDSRETKIDKRIPRLERIFRDWHQDWSLKTAQEMSSNESSGNVNDVDGEATRAPKPRERINETTETDIQGSKARPNGASVSQNQKKQRLDDRNFPSSSSSSLSSSSDSDADDVKGRSRRELKTSTKQFEHAPTVRPTMGDMINRLKRKVPSSSSDSTTDPSADERPVRVKKQKTKSCPSPPATSEPASMVTKPKIKSNVAVSVSSAKATKATGTASDKLNAGAAATSSEDSSDSSSDSDVDTSSESASFVAVKVNGARHSSSETSSSTSSCTESDSDSESSTDSDSDSDLAGQIRQDVNAKRSTKAPSVPSVPSESSATISGDTHEPRPTTKPTPASSSAKAKKQPKPPQPRLSSKSTHSADPRANPNPEGPEVNPEPEPHPDPNLHPDLNLHPSNSYQSYSYADRAYKDLSITRGKGFTKEKNKKKRGSYRGGAIDISAGAGAGGRGFKFED